MATDNDTNRGASPTGSDKKGILRKARSDWDRALDRERENIRLAYEDLEFLSGGYSQWPERQRRDREDQNRPVLTINRLPQFIHQITGDMRQMKPSLKFVPVDDEGDEKVADLYGGLSRYIENRSDATAVYNRGADSQVACGIGHWRVLTEYADDSTFNQEIRIAPIEDGVAVLWDPDSTLPSKEDAKYCFVPIDMSRKAFEAEWPGVNPADFDDEKWGQNHEWLTDDYVRIVEYWTRKPSKRTLALTQNGAILDLTDEDDSAIALAKQHGARIEKRDSYKICRYLITASAVLEETDWLGRLIPIIPVIGEEIRIGRKVIRSGVVRNAKDPQMMVNYFHSAHTEIVALQPKAPFLVTEINVAKYQAMWEQANTQNYPYLAYEPDAKNGGQAPQRVQPPVASQGIIEGLTMAQEDMKAVIGIYDASLGAKSNETSGVAIARRQKEGDTGSYLYIDNFARAIRRTGQILVDLIPHVYDTERSIRIMGEDGKIDIVEINKAEGIGPDAKIVHDVTVGNYDVVATMGPSYTTRREESREGMISLMQAAPEVAPIMIDLFAKSQDWPLADDIAKRARAVMPPQVLQAEELEKQGVPPEQITQIMQQQQSQQPSPELAAVQGKLQLAQMESQAKLQQAQQESQIQAQLDAAKQSHAAEMARMELQSKIELARIELQGELELQKARNDGALAVEEAKAGKQIELEWAKARAYIDIDQHKANAEAQRKQAVDAADADLADRKMQRDAALAERTHAHKVSLEERAKAEKDKPKKTTIKKEPDGSYTKVEIG